jgi:hypothetical protein
VAVMSKLDPAMGMGMEIDLRLDVETEKWKDCDMMVVKACSPENSPRY